MNIMSEKDTIRLQKYLSRRGVASRRKAADMIKAGRVAVDGVIVYDAGFRIDEQSAEVALDGKLLENRVEIKRVIAMYKPRGYICSMSDRQGKSIISLLDGIPERVVPAGRLDKDSEGLLILSNDGTLINQLTHPAHGHTKVYHVSVTGRINRYILDELRTPIEIDGRKTRPALVSIIAKNEKTHILEFKIGEGRHHQIRKLCKRSGLEVRKLKRVQINNLKLDDLKLKPGQWIELESLQCL